MPGLTAKTEHGQRQPTTALHDLLDDVSGVSVHWMATLRPHHGPVAHTGPLKAEDIERSHRCDSASTFGKGTAAHQPLDRRSATLRMQRLCPPRTEELFIVHFTRHRAEAFYLLDNTGLFIKDGDFGSLKAHRSLE